MKNIGRTFIILATALLVVGATVAFSHTSLATQQASGSTQKGIPPQSEFDRGTQEMDGDDIQGGFVEGDSQEGFRSEMRADGKHQEGSTWFTWLKNLSMIGIIVLGVALLEHIQFYKLRKAYKTK